MTPCVEMSRLPPEQQGFITVNPGQSPDATAKTERDNTKQLEVYGGDMQTGLQCLTEMLVCFT